MMSCPSTSPRIFQPSSGVRCRYTSGVLVLTHVFVAHTADVIVQALAAATDPTLLQAALDFSISSEVRSQDTTTVVDRVALNPLGRVLAFDFVKQHWELFDERCVRVGGCARGCCGCWRALPCHRLRTH